LVFNGILVVFANDWAFLFTDLNHENLGILVVLDDLLSIGGCYSSTSSDEDISANYVRVF